METNLLRCSCNSNEHIVIFDYDEEYNEIFMSVHLNPLGIFGRVKHAIKYIFGYKCKFGDFEELIIDHTNVEQFIKALSNIKQ